MTGLRAGPSRAGARPAPAAPPPGRGTAGGREAVVAGCYGKVPALGDFLSRNLPARFIETWYGWLRGALAECARAGGQRAAVPGENRAHRGRGPSDGLFGQFRSVGVARRLAGQRAQAEALALVEGRALQPAVVENQAFGLGVFQEQFAIVRAVQRVRSKAVHPRAVHAGAVEKQAVGRCDVAHGVSG